MILQVKSLTCSYDDKKVIEDISFKIQSGSVVSLLGANGTGKSTLFKAIAGLLPYSGDIFIQEKNVKKLSHKQRASLLAYVPQSFSIPFDFSVLEVVLMARFHASGLSLNYSKEDHDIAIESLKRVGAEDFATKTYSHLSGGERQLILLARALAQQSPMIIMDEPVTGLDLGNQVRLMDLMQDLQSQGYTILQTTHYPDHALLISDQVLWLHQGSLIADACAKEAITPQRVQEVYGIQSEILHHESGRSFLLPLSKSNKEKL